MKLRLQGNSLRLRLTRSEVARFREVGLVEESVDFGGGEVLTYRLQTHPDPGPPHAGFLAGGVTVSIARDTAHSWAGSDEVGVYAQAGVLNLSIEKDFRCLTRPLDERERDAYTHPEELSKRS